MRLRNIPGSKELLLAEPQLVLRAETAPRGCWRQHFWAQGSRAEKLCLEIGCGRGRFANTMAQDFPELNIIGWKNMILFWRKPWEMLRQQPQLIWLFCGWTLTC